MILTLQTTTFSKLGGIPTYNRLVCRALDEIAANLKTEVFIATDQPSDLVQPSKELGRLTLRAFDNKRIKLAQAVMHRAMTQKIELALIGHANYAPLGWMVKRIQSRARTGVLLYGIEAWQPLPTLKRRALQQSDFFIAISEYTKRMAAAANDLDPERIHVLPNALEWSSKPSANRDAVNNPMRTTLLSVCRLDKYEQYKGVDHVIEVLPKVAEKIPDVHYVVVGDGTDLERHKQLAVNCGVADRVSFLGFIENERLHQRYHECDVFVMPSGGEGFGFVFLEAMKYAKPIVAANSGGAPEVVQDGVTGKLLEFGNRQQLAEALIEMCGDGEMQQRLGQAGNELLERQFVYSHFRNGLSRILAQEMPATITGTQQWSQVNADQA